MRFQYAELLRVLCNSHGMRRLPYITVIRQSVRVLEQLRLDYRMMVGTDWI
jgi:hypothetical protein